MKKPKTNEHSLRLSRTCVDFFKTTQYLRDIVDSGVYKANRPISVLIVHRDQHYSQTQKALAIKTI